MLSDYQMNARILSCAVLALVYLMAVAHEAVAADQIVQAGRGRVLVHVPPGYDPAVPAPLVLLLEGYTTSPQDAEGYFQVTPLSDEFGFLYSYPAGTADPNGNSFWNATAACCDFFGSGVDDSAYLLALIGAIKAQLDVDTRRIYLFGWSNGGFMAHRMACDHADTIAAIANLAGATHHDPGDCSPSEPVHVLQVHGTADATILYGGGDIAGNTYPGAVETVEQSALHNGCTPVGDSFAQPLDLDASIAGTETDITRYQSDCSEGGSAELWTINGAGHQPVLAADFSRRVVEHLFAHPKPSPNVLVLSNHGNAALMLAILVLASIHLARSVQNHVSL